MSLGRSWWSPTRPPACRRRSRPSTGSSSYRSRSSSAPTCTTRASEGATPELVAAALKEFRPVSTSRPTPAALLEVYEQAARDGATEIVSIHLSARHERHLRVRAAGGAGRAGAGASPSTAGRSGWRPGTPRCPRPRSSRPAASAEEAAEAALARAAASSVAVLRRHPGVPAPRRPDRRGRGAVRRRALGQAAAEDRERHGRVAWSGCARRAGRWPGWRSWPSRPRGTSSGRRVRRAPGVARTGPAQLTEHLADAARGQPGGARGLVRRARRRARCARRARACWPSASRRCSDATVPSTAWPAPVGVRPQAARTARPASGVARP